MSEPNDTDAALRLLRELGASQPTKGDLARIEHRLQLMTINIVGAIAAGALAVIAVVGLLVLFTR